MHTYPFHDTHYNPQFWESPVEEADGYSDHDRVLMAMQRAAFYAQGQYESVKNYVHAIAPTKPIHIGETGWSSTSITCTATALLLLMNTSKLYTTRLCESGSGC